MANNEREFIRIEGSLVSLVKETLVRNVSLDDWTAKVIEQSPVSTGILPRGCRFYQRSENETVFVLEELPQVRTLLWTQMSGASIDGTRFSVALPFCIWVVRFNSMGKFQSAFLYYATKPVLDQNASLSYPNLTNLYPDCRVCTGMMRMEAKPTDSLAVQTESFVATFWQSPFNADLKHRFLAYGRQNEQLRTLENWQAASAENPAFMLVMPWEKATTVKDAMGG